MALVEQLKIALKSAARWRRCCGGPGIRSSTCGRCWRPSCCSARIFSYPCVADRDRAGRVPGEGEVVIQRLPAWGTTLGSRIARQPKVHLVDSGVASWLLDVTPAKIARVTLPP
jgi:hypothetical protein